MAVTQQTDNVYQFETILQIARALCERSSTSLRWWDQEKYIPNAFSGGIITTRICTTLYKSVLNMLQDGWFYVKQQVSQQQSPIQRVTVDYILSRLNMKTPPSPPTIGTPLKQKSFINFLRFMCQAISCMCIKSFNPADFFVEGRYKPISTAVDGGSENLYEIQELRYKTMSIANKNIEIDITDSSIYYISAFVGSSYIRSWDSDMQQYSSEESSAFGLSKQCVVSSENYGVNSTAYPISIIGLVHRQYPDQWGNQVSPRLQFKDKFPEPSDVVNAHGVLISLWSPWVYQFGTKVSQDLYIYETPFIQSNQSCLNLWKQFTGQPSKITRDDLPTQIAVSNYNAKTYAEDFQDTNQPQHPHTKGQFSIRCVIGGKFDMTYIKFNFQYNPSIKMSQEV